MTRGLICQNLEILLNVQSSSFLLASFLQERPKTIETHQDLHEFTSSIDFLQDSTLGPSVFSNFQYIPDFGQDIQDLVS